MAAFTASKYLDPINNIGTPEYQASKPNATHGAFVKAIRQACYRAKPMKFRTAVYDDYEAGAMAVERLS